MLHGWPRESQKSMVESVDVIDVTVTGSYRSTMQCISIQEHALLIITFQLIPFFNHISLDGSF